MRDLNQIERAILAGAVADLQRNRRLKVDYATGWHARHAAKDSAAAGLVRCDPVRWLDRPLDNAALRMAVSRSYAALEKRGLADRVTGGWSETRTMYLAPTKAGIELAKKL